MLHKKSNDVNKNNKSDAKKDYKDQNIAFEMK